MKCDDLMSCNAGNEVFQTVWQQLGSKEESQHTVSNSESAMPLLYGLYVCEIAVHTKFYKKVTVLLLFV